MIKLLPNTKLESQAKNRKANETDISCEMIENRARQAKAPIRERNKIEKL